MCLAFRYTVVFFFFLMLVLPTTFQLQRGVLLGALAFTALVGALKIWKVDWELLIIFLFILGTGAFYVLWGYLHSAPGALRVATVFIVWPTVYMLFLGLIRYPESIVLFEKTIIVGIITSGLMGVFLVFGALIDEKQAVVNILSFQGAAVGIYHGLIEYNLFNMTTVIYGLPFLVALTMVPKGDFFRNNWWRLIVWLALLITLIVCIISGRRAFWGLAIITPILVGALFAFSGLNHSARRMIYCLFFVFPVIVGIIVSFGLDAEVLANKFQNAFNFSRGGSANVRYEQFFALISAWNERPIIGGGLGASLDTIVRDPNMPWAYELSYVALLFQTGLLGLLIYSAAILWIFYAGIRIVRFRKEAAVVIIPLLAGLAGFLLINATNPYLQKFDYLWTIFLPVAAINVYRNSSSLSILS
ncbi:MAG: hypothetical protein J5I81_01150 [Nitrococcus mobilis]|nr:hypothetical protein [Nitrococcus mobilis]